MSRKSERELERAVADLGSKADSVRDWAEGYIERMIAEHGFDLEWSASGVTLRNPAAMSVSSNARVPVLELSEGTFFAPRSDLPAWIEPEALPLKA